MKYRIEIALIIILLLEFFVFGYCTAYFIFTK